MADTKVIFQLIADARRMKEGMRQGEHSMKNFANKAKAEVSKLRQVFGGLQGKLAGMGFSIGTGALIWQSAQLDKSLIQIGQTAGATKQQMAELRGDLFRLGKESGQDVDKLREGFEVLVQSGLNIKESRATLEGVNAAMAVSGADAKALAGGLTVAATAFQFDLAKPGQALELLDKMTVAGRKGNAELSNLSDVFARIGVNASSAKMGFEKTLAFVEGLSMIERQPERLATLADSTLRMFTNLKYMKDAQKGTGVKFFDAKGMRRDAIDVIDDMRKKYKTLTTDVQRINFIDAAFGKTDQETRKGIEKLLTGDELDKVKQFAKEIGDAGGTLKRDMDDATRNLVDQAGRLKATLREAADGFSAPIKDVLTDLIKWGMDSKENGGLDLTGKDMVVGGATAITTTAIIGRYAKKVLESITGKKGKALPSTAVNFFKDKANLAAGIAEGKALASLGIMPVYVTNWPGSAALPTPGDVGALKKTGEMAIKTAPALGSAAATGSAALMSIGIITGSVYSMVRSLIDRKWGLENGTWRTGTPGDAAIEALIKHDENKKPPEVKNDIKLNISIDQFMRAIVDNSMNPNTNLKISVARGTF